VRKELKTMNNAVEGIQKIVENLRETTNKAYAEVLEEVQQKVKRIKEICKSQKIDHMLMI